MNEVERQPKTEIAAAVAALLQVFHEHTPEKSRLAPIDSVKLCHTLNGVTEVDEAGWCTDYDDTTEDDATVVLPISVVDREKP
ncbi:hypothetical protein ACFYOW_40295 [Nocardia sp. NPDC006982]|uniref:hypothetical protein n=1 Tax=Nocardia sp. NPDC006982 TaxID=3364307 RepID=UPI0036A6C68C